MVFQSYALYPHMTVRENMALRASSPARAQGRDRRARAPRRPSVLQLDAPPRPQARGSSPAASASASRSAARSCASPKVFLFDEPLSNLDAALRVAHAPRAREAAPATSATTMVYVTHDQVEAMTLADRIVVLQRRPDRAGRHAARALPPAGQPLRRGLHRLAQDELHARQVRRSVATSTP